jgi:hypothetical protein
MEIEVDFEREVAPETKHFFVEADLEEPLVEEEGQKPPNSESQDVQSIAQFLMLPLVTHDWVNNNGAPCIMDLNKSYILTLEKESSRLRLGDFLE